MKRLLWMVLAVLSLTVAVSAPATAAPSTAQVGYCNKHEYTTGGAYFQITILTQMEGVDCVTYFMSTRGNYPAHQGTSGTWELWGPRGWAQNIPGDLYVGVRTDPNRSTYVGDLWCARFRFPSGAVLDQYCLTKSK